MALRQISDFAALNHDGDLIRALKQEVPLPGPEEKNHVLLPTTAKPLVRAAAMGSTTPTTLAKPMPGAGHLTVSAL